MLPKENPEEFYSRFHEQLLNSQDWPGQYLFKFILREGEVNEQVLKDMFTQNEAVFSKKASSKKTFTSLSVKVIMEDPDAVIAIYKKAQKIKGLITL
jgi:putative lipoic acid-binding regulatory protein